MQRTGAAGIVFSSERCWGAAPAADQLHVSLPMAIDLSNQTSGHHRFSFKGWALALIVAEHFGWKPAGTPRPAEWDDADGPWEGEYAINAGQSVTHEDATACAEALERAAASDGFVRVAQRGVNDLNAELIRVHPSAKDEVQRMPEEEAEEFRARMIDLAKFARQGTFVIE